MKKNLLIFTVLYCVLFSSCVKNTTCQEVSPASEEAKIKEFASAHNINASKDPSGLYYQILDRGSAIKPSLTSTVFTTYIGRHLDYNIFEQHSTPIKFLLGSVIPGWQIGLPLIGKGGHILLIIPSSLAYGCASVGSIRQNEIIFFDVTISDIQ